MTEPVLSTTAESSLADELPATQGDYELEQRSSLRRVAGLSTELTDVTEVGVEALEQSRLALRLSRPDAAALRAELHALLERYAARPDAPDGEAVALYVSVYPGTAPPAGG